MGLGLGRRECCMKTIGSSMKGRCHPSTSDHHGPPLSQPSPLSESSIGWISSNMIFKRIARCCTARIEGQLAKDRMDMTIYCVRA